MGVLRAIFANVVVRVAVTIAIIAIIGVLAFVFRDRLSANASELQIGDCFDVPQVLTDIKDVQHHPCTEAHTGEVFAQVKDPAPGGAPPPTNDQVLSVIRDQCLPIMSTYIGEDAMSQQVLDFGAFYPNDSDWNSGSRDYTCYLYRVDNAAMTATMKGAKP